MIIFLLACAASQDITIEFNGDSQSQTGDMEESSEDTSSPSESISPSDLNLSDDDCDDAPPVTWNNWVQSMLITHCQGCHASTSPSRYGAPLAIHFDHEQAAIDQADRIYMRVLHNQDMPPAGGILEADLYFLDVWLRCSVGL